MIIFGEVISDLWILFPKLHWIWISKNFGGQFWNARIENEFYSFSRCMAVPKSWNRFCWECFKTGFIIFGVIFGELWIFSSKLTELGFLKNGFQISFSMTIFCFGQINQIIIERKSVGYKLNWLNNLVEFPKGTWKRNLVLGLRTSDENRMTLDSWMRLLINWNEMRNMLN